MGPWAHGKHCPSQGKTLASPLHGTPRGDPYDPGVRRDPRWVARESMSFFGSYRGVQDSIQAPRCLEKIENQRKSTFQGVAGKGARGCYDSGVVQRGVDVAKKIIQGGPGPPPFREKSA